MKKYLLFNKYYLFSFILLFLTEVYIAIYVHDTIIRPYIGDVLVVILIYCFIKSFISISINTNAIAVLLFSFFVETLQYFKIVHILHLQDNTLARIIIGTSFAWLDIASYTAGIILVWIVEKIIYKEKPVIKF